MKFLGLSHAARFTLNRFYMLFLVKLPHSILFEMKKLCKFFGVKNHTVLKTFELFLDKFEYGPLVNRHTLLLLAPDLSKLYCPIYDEWIVKEIYLGKVYDRFFEPNEGFTVVDVGAHVGIYTLKAARKVGKQGLLVSIEPDPYAYKFLVTNVKMNNFDQNVIPINIALADSEGKAFFYSSARPSRSAYGSLKPFAKIEKKRIEVQVNTLDGVMKKLRLRHCDLLKIDVEGYELQVLQGAKNTLKNMSMVAVAAYHSEGEVEAVKNFLKSEGFRTVLSKASIVYALR